MNLEIYDYRATSHQQYLQFEPFYSTSAQQVILKSICFNETKIDVQQSLQILNELIYVLNQGQQINQNEIDLLYFRVTKLLQFDCLSLKTMAYFTLKLISNQSNKWILIQIVLNDIQSQKIIKLNALRLISHLQDLVNPNTMERILRNCILSYSQLLSSAAMLVGLKFLKNHPTMIRRLTNELFERLSDKYSQNNFHALLLLYESKKDDQLKLLNQLIKLDLSPMAKFQVIRFIRFQLQHTVENQLNSNEFSQENINYLLQVVNSSEPLLILEAAKSIVLIEYFSEEALKLIISSISQFLKSNACYVSKYAGLSIVKKIINNKIDPLSTFPQQFITLIENLSFDRSVTISSIAIELIYIIFQQNTSKKLAKIYNVKINVQFLQGIHEAFVMNPRMVQQIIEFINLIFERIDMGSIDILLNIIEQIMEDVPQYKDAAIDILIRIGYISDKYKKFAVLLVLSRQLRGIDYQAMEYSEILAQLKLFESQYLLNKQKLFDLQNTYEEQFKITQVEQAQFQLMEQSTEQTKNTDVEIEYSIIKT
ncbi:Coatomer subunit gamma-1 [Paramecium bursaria]